MCEGSAEDKAALRNSTDGLQRFCSDLKEITLSQNREIHQLQNDVLEGFRYVQMLWFFFRT